MNAEIIAIGTEILLGEIVDTNSRHIARALRDLGLDLYWTSSVGDNPDRIAEAVAHGLTRSDVVITTGGLGPTVDDPTREGVAKAVGRPLEFREELWEQITQRFARWGRTATENNRRQAYVPVGSLVIENPVGTAPAFVVEVERLPTDRRPTTAVRGLPSAVETTDPSASLRTRVVTTQGQVVICLPGVPAEMEHLLESAVIPYLQSKFDLRGVIKARSLRTSGLGESQLDQKIGDLEALQNPTVGLAAHSGIVDIRITAKAGNSMEADKLISDVEATLRQRLGNAIFGADDQTLEATVLALLEQRGWRLAVVEAGTGGRLSGRLSGAAARAAATDGAGGKSGETFAGGQVLSSENFADLENLLAETRASLNAQVGLGLKVTPRVNGRTDLALVLHSPLGDESLNQGYGGPFPNVPAWSANLALNLLRLRLLD